MSIFHYLKIWSFESFSDQEKNLKDWFKDILHLLLEMLLLTHARKHGDLIESKPLACMLASMANS